MRAGAPADCSAVLTNRRQAAPSRERAQADLRRHGPRHNRSEDPSQPLSDTHALKARLSLEPRRACAERRPASGQHETILLPGDHRIKGQTCRRRSSAGPSLVVGPGVTTCLRWDQSARWGRSADAVTARLTVTVAHYTCLWSRSRSGQRGRRQPARYGEGRRASATPAIPTDEETTRWRPRAETSVRPTPKPPAVQPRAVLGLLGGRLPLRRYR